MRLQNSAAILLTQHDEFLSPRQMSELLNFKPKQSKKIQRRLSCYCSNNHFKGYPCVKSASEYDKEKYLYWREYVAANGQTYRCYSGAIYKHHYGDKAQLHAASFLISVLFLRNNAIYETEDLLTNMKELNLFLASNSSEDNHSLKNKISQYIDFLNSPASILGYQLKEVIDSHRFRSWLHRLSVLPENQPAFMLPIAFRFIGLSIIAFQREVSRKESWLRASHSARSISRKIGTEKSRQPFQMRKLALLKLFKRQCRKPLIARICVAAALLLYMTYPFIFKEKNQDRDFSLIAISVPAEPPI